MTRIVYDREGLRLSMEGHALAGHYGQDIICAAESMLIMCLEKRLLDMGEDVSLTVKKSPGCISISALPSLALEERCRESFDTIYAGCALLARYEPDYVSAREYMKEEEQWN
jgi:uncharacterized protein YsxB (DUF464 family)